MQAEQTVPADGADERSIRDTYLTFVVAHETYSVNIGCVTEIVGMQPIARIPQVPAFIKGAMNLRGKVIPVMDQRLRFGLPPREYDDRTAIIVLDVEGAPTGLVVDQVTDVVTIAQDAIDPPPPLLCQGEGGVMRGIGRWDDHISVILDVRQLMSEKPARPERARSTPGVLKGETTASPPADERSDA